MTRAASWYGDVLGAKLVHRGLLHDGSLSYVELRAGEFFLHIVRWHEPPPGRQDEHWPAPAKALRGTSVLVWLFVDDVDVTMERAVATGATQHPLTRVETIFSGDRIGQFRDPFDYFWRVSTKREQVTQEMADQRLAELRAVHSANGRGARPS